MVIDKNAKPKTCIGCQEMTKFNFLQIPKYHNKKITTLDNEVFDSKGEYVAWKQLQYQERAGLIKDLHRQVKFELIPAQYEKPENAIIKNAKNKKPKLLERSCSYIADFVYTDISTNKLVVCDFKGIKTPEYIIKRKLMLYIYGVKIEELTK